MAVNGPQGGEAPEGQAHLGMGGRGEERGMEGWGDGRGCGVVEGGMGWEERNTNTLEKKRVGGGGGNQYPRTYAPTSHSLPPFEEHTQTHIYPPTHLLGRPRGRETAAVGLELGRQVGDGPQGHGRHVRVGVVLREGQRGHGDLACAWGRGRGGVVVGVGGGGVEMGVGGDVWCIL